MDSNRVSFTVHQITNEDGTHSFFFEEYYESSSGEIEHCKKLHPSTTSAIGQLLLTAFHQPESVVVSIVSQGSLSRAFEFLKMRKEKSGSANEVLQRYITPEYVYFIYNPETDLTKVGKTLNVKRRLSDIRREVGKECILLNSYRCLQISGYELESTIHRYFKMVGTHSHGEWFRLTPYHHILEKKAEGYQVLPNVRRLIRELKK